ncbi:MAG: AraC family transcriptional regulator [Enterococcus sp.]|nr:AraC family transcriptional regulator [Enterococcus sp.]
MDYLTLDSLIRKISPHEKSYRDDCLKSDFSTYNKTMANNQEILIMELSNSQVFTTEQPFFIKKHSRFQDYPIHSHDWIEFNYMYSGQCLQIINNEPHLLYEGQVLLLDAKTIHKIEPLGENDILINLIIPKYYLTANFFNRFSSDSVLTTFFIEAITKGMRHDRFIHFSSEKHRRLQFFFKELLCEWFDRSSAFTDICESLLSLIISELVNIYQYSYTNDADQLRKNPIIPIMKYIEKNYSDVTLSELSNQFNLNPNYLSNLLKKHTGYSYKKIVIKQRILAADRFLLSTDMDIVEISQQVGFENINFFYQKFKEVYGVTPGIRRKLHFQKKN